VIIATAKGFNDAQKTVEVSDKTAQDVVITMLPLSTGPGPEGPPVIAPVEPASKVPLYIMVGGGVVVAGAAASHLLWYKGVHDDLKTAGDAGDSTEYNRLLPKFNRARAVTIGLYAAGGAAVITGLILKFTVFEGKEAPAQVSVVPTNGGGMFTVGWSR
jgi:hypothetical protein